MERGYTFNLDKNDIEHWKQMAEQFTGDHMTDAVRYSVHYHNQNEEIIVGSKENPFQYPKDRFSDSAIDVDCEVVESILHEQPSSSKGPFCSTCGHENDGTCWRRNCPN